MIVDNNPRMRAVIRSAFSKARHEFMELSDGSEAVEAYPDFRPNWILMDITEDGIEATRLLKKRYPDAKIVIVSQYDDKNLKDRARRAGATEYVLKEDLTALTGIIF